MATPFDDNTNQLGRYLEILDHPSDPDLIGRIGLITKDGPDGREIHVLDSESVQEVLASEVEMMCRPLSCYDDAVDYCASCEKRFRESRLSGCAHCRMVFYCSKKCQKIHWNATHKDSCEQLRSVRKNADKDEASEAGEKDEGDGEDEGLGPLSIDSIVQRARERQLLGERELRRGRPERADFYFIEALEQTRVPAPGAGREHLQIAGREHLQILLLMRRATCISRRCRKDRALQFLEVATDWWYEDHDERGRTSHKQACMQLGHLRREEMMDGAREAYESASKIDPNDIEAKTFVALSMMNES